jgi:uncharacterized RDD family membrane protein YckC
MSQRFFSESHLQVDPDLVGRPLAPPVRRLVAFLLDWVIVILPTVAVGLAGTAVSLRLTDPAGARALWAVATSDALEPAARRQALRDLAPLLARHRMEGLPVEVVAAVERGDLDGAAEALETCDFMFALALGERPEEELKRGMVRVELEKFIPRGSRGVVLFCVPALYFTLLARGRRGATPGKRLLGLRVATLGGERLSLRDSFERFAGYFGEAASVGLGLFDLWHEPNRRLAHDRATGTVVLLARPQRAPAEAAPPAAPEAEAASD